MSSFSSHLLETLRARGYIQDVTDPAGLDEAASAQPIKVYIGFDCTASSLHVGNLVQIMMLRVAQQTGHKPIVLLGGGTTKIGDPSGKDESRRVLSEENIAANMAGIGRAFEKFLRFGDGPTDAVLVNNADWLERLEYIPFLRDYGRHFSVNRMLSFDSVKLRLEREQPLSFLEFNYMILQAYDFLELHRRHGCILQMGGSDQWGNIVNGIELGRRVDGAHLHGLTTPLITTADGAKMGKSAQGAVWLNPDMLSAYDYWQFWRNTQDADVGRFLRLFTDLPLDEIERLEGLRDREINDAKKILADQATRLCHGDQAAREAAETARRTFEQGEGGDALPSVELAVPTAIIDLMVTTGLAASKGEARRLIRQGGARLDGAAITDETRLVAASDFAGRDAVTLSAGKKRHALLKLPAQGSPQNLG